GSVATSGPEFARFGGNTTCVEVLVGGQRIVFDAGTGIRGLGQRMMKSARPGRTAIFWSHLHWDHIQGFPFFAPAFARGTELELYGPGEGGGARLKSALSAQMQPPSFPVTLEAMGAAMEFHDARVGEPVVLREAVVTPISLDHPNGCLGYRVDGEGASVVFCTDVELGGRIREDLVEFARGADLLIFDAQFTPSEYEGKVGPSRKGWGHSTMIEAARLAAAAEVKNLALTHHDPAHGDRIVERMESAARFTFNNTAAAREGERFEFGPSRLLAAR
ncbi:MAG TPA: MBL fold metallo-hydrolase, partial [bacterium]|nr:MBL fold metallo-hydrolase [bacterium]